MGCPLSISVDECLTNSPSVQDNSASYSSRFYGFWLQPKRFFFQSSDSKSVTASGLTVEAESAAELNIFARRSLNSLSKHDPIVQTR